jgi:glucose-6-phosphate isomerase
VNINAYHQPGVEAGKKAAQAVIALQAKVIQGLGGAGDGVTVDELAARIGEPGEAETVWRICEHLVGNGRARRVDGDGPFSARYLA